MRIAVFLESDPCLGGAVQQSLSTVEALTRTGAIKHEVVVFTQSEEMRQVLLKQGISAIKFKHKGYRLIDRWSATVVGYALLRRLRGLGFRRLGRHLDALLDDHGIALAIFNNCQSDVVARIGEHPFIISVWDTDHRDHPEFPEAYSDRAFERIERKLAVTLRRALAVISNSQSGAHRIASLYNVDLSRIIVLPFLPSPTVRRNAEGKGTVTAAAVRKKYNLPPQYVFYPAYSAFHKNCLYLLEGLIELERQHQIVLDAVFCGGGSPEIFQFIKRQVQALGLASRVHFLGFVPDADLPALYEGALSLVMPSYFGPTNLPPLEAVTLGCPVICSDLAGCREQMGEAALYCDLSDVSSLADQLATLIQDADLRDRLREAGRKLSTELAAVDYGARLSRVLDDYEYVRRRWAWPEKTHAPYRVRLATPVLAERQERAAPPCGASRERDLSAAR